MAVDFDGTDDRIDWANVFSPTGSALTISCWAYFDAVTDDHYLFAINNSSALAGVILWNPGNLGLSGRLQFNRTGSTSKLRNSVGSTLATGSWHHIAATDSATYTDATTIHLYVNGTEVTYTTTTNGSTEDTYSGTWSIGSRTSDDLRSFNGRIAEVGVWDRQMSDAEVASLAAGYSPRFYPSGLRFYAPLMGRGTETNLLGAAASNTVGTAYVEHPRIIYPCGHDAELGTDDGAVGVGMILNWMLVGRNLVA